MGHDVYRDVLDNAPDDLVPADRLLLAALGDLVDERSREGEYPAEVIRHQTGLSADALRKAFQRLANRAGGSLDPRVPIGTDSRGRPVFAYKGTVTRYRVPTFEQRPTPYQRTDGGGIRYGKRRELSPTFDDKGGNVVPQRRESVPTKVGTQSRKGGTTFPPNPYPQSPYIPRVTLTALDALNATPDEKRRVTAEIERNTKKPITDMGAYLAAMHSRGQLAPILDAIRAPERDRLANERDRRARAQPLCEHGGMHGKCPMCRREQASVAPVIHLPLPA